PTYGTISRYGVIAFASSLDQVGPLTRTVKDNATLLNAVSGKDDKDNTSADLTIDFTEKIGQKIQGLKIGVPKEFFDENLVEAHVLQTVHQAVNQLKELGAEVVEVSLPHLKYGVPAYYAIATAEASSNLQRFDGIRYGYSAENAKSLEDLYVKTRSEVFGSEVKRRLVLGGISLSVEYYEELYGKATKVRTIIRNEFEAALKEVDVLVGPSPTTVAPNIENKEGQEPVEAYTDDVLTVGVNLAGIPSLNIPVGFHENMPVGMQIIGDYFEEA